MFNVDLRSRTPIYQQLVNNIKQLILNNTMEADTKIPSVRELASKLAINPNTIQKAYAILEKDGFIYSVRGRGNFVSKLEKKVLENEMEGIMKNLYEVLDKAYNMNLKEKELIQMIKEYYKNKESESSDKNK